MMASKPRSLMLQHRKMRLWMPVAPWGKFWMKSKMSASLAFNRQMVSKPRCLSELKKFCFIWSPWLELEETGLVVISVTELDSALFELTSIFFSLFEKLELVMDWLDSDEVAVLEDMQVDPEAEDQDRIARQWMTGRTSRQNSGWYKTSLHLWQTWANRARSFWCGNSEKKSKRNLLSCHSSSHVINLKDRLKILDLNRKK